MNKWSTLSYNYAIDLIWQEMSIMSTLQPIGVQIVVNVRFDVKGHDWRLNVFGGDDGGGIETWLANGRVVKFPLDH